MITTLAYITCDRCGSPAGTADDMRDNPKSARQRARALGFRRVHSSHLPDVDGLRMVDICPVCIVATGVNP